MNDRELRQAALGLLAGAIRQIAGAFGINLYRFTSDRRFLEGAIIPYLAAEPAFGRLLVVGCEWYTAHYPGFFQGKRLTTLDLNPAVARYGAAHHIVDRLERLGAHFEAESLDAIVASGVIGWGLNDPVDIEVALEECVAALRPGGLLIIGWNNVPNRRPLVPRLARALAPLKPFEFPPIRSSTFQCNGANRHTFDFFQKPEAHRAPTSGGPFV